MSKRTSNRESGFEVQNEDIKEHNILSSLDISFIN
jgi:hypothetical protein